MGRVWGQNGRFPEHVRLARKCLFWHLLYRELGHAATYLVEALFSKPEGRVFDSG
jgi:hypothetical protein